MLDINSNYKKAFLIRWKKKEKKTPLCTRELQCKTRTIYTSIKLRILIWFEEFREKKKLSFIHYLIWGLRNMNGWKVLNDVYIFLRRKVKERDWEKKHVWLFWQKISYRSSWNAMTLIFFFNKPLDTLDKSRLWSLSLSYKNKNTQKAVQCFSLFDLLLTHKNR